MSDETKSRPRVGVRDFMAQTAAAIWAGCAARPEVLEPPPKPKPPVPRPKGAPHVDFHLVPAHQFEMDARLRNWGTWCNSRTAIASSSPMFRLSPPSIVSRREYQSSSRAGDAVDRSDAVCIARAVTALPYPQATALNWYYVKPVAPRRAAESLGLSYEGLAALVIEARQALINRLEQWG